MSTSKLPRLVPGARALIIGGGHRGGRGEVVSAGPAWVTVRVDDATIQPLVRVRRHQVAVVSHSCDPRSRDTLLR